jgi:carbon monoxide dehydrogenase subunit G
MNKKVRIENKIRIEASAAEVWAVLSDLSHVHKYSLGAKHALITADRQSGVEAGRHCDLAPFSSVEELVVDWIEEKSMNIEITGVQGLPPIRNITGRFNLTPSGSGTQVHGRMEYVPKFGLLGAVISSLAVKPRFNSDFKRLLRGLKNYVEEDGPVSHSAVATELKPVDVEAGSFKFLLQN